MVAILYANRKKTQKLMPTQMNVLILIAYYFLMRMEYNTQSYLRFLEPLYHTWS